MSRDVLLCCVCRSQSHLKILMQLCLIWTYSLRSPNVSSTICVCVCVVHY